MFPDAAKEQREKTSKLQLFLLNLHSHVHSVLTISSLFKRSKTATGDDLSHCNVSAPFTSMTNYPSLLANIQINTVLALCGKTLVAGGGGGGLQGRLL